VTDWYYSRQGQRLGPIEEADFHQKIESGEIHQETFVWRKGMENWQKYGELYYGESYQSAALYRCYECGRSFPVDEMVRHYQYMVCAECKPVFFQRLQEGAILPGMMGYMVYGGFWIRFLAKFIDNFITTILTYLILIIMAVGMAALTGDTQVEPPLLAMFITVALFYFFMLSIPAAYNTFFIGKYQSTPGKMALSLKVIRPDGSPISYWRAFGRHFAEILSGLILMIGYIMAAFDDEKRALHDMICDTRVVKK